MGERGAGWIAQAIDARIRRTKRRLRRTCLSLNEDATMLAVTGSTGSTGSMQLHGPSATPVLATVEDRGAQQHFECEAPYKEAF